MKLLISLLCAFLAPLLCGAQETPAAGTNQRVEIVTTLGNFTIELDSARAPLTVESFLGYVNSGQFDGTIFHRVIQGFVAQAGGFTQDLTLKPVEGSVANEAGNGLSNLRGTVGLARANEPHSGSSQFYVNLADNLDLNPRPTRWGYAVFGTVVEGMEIIDEIGHRPTGAAGNFERNVPVDAIIIQSARELSE